MARIFPKGNEVSWWDGDCSQWRGLFNNAIKDNVVQSKIRHANGSDVDATRWIKHKERTWSDNPTVKYINKKILPKLCVPPYPTYYFNRLSNKHYIIISINATDVVNFTCII